MVDGICLFLRFKFLLVREWLHFLAMRKIVNNFPRYTLRFDLDESGHIISLYILAQDHIYPQ
jgi:hypothetical protein